MEFLDDKTAAHLGWEELLGRLSQLVLTPLGAAACRRLRPLDDLGRLRRRQERLEQLCRLLDQGEDPPLEPVEDVRGELERAAKHGVLDGEAVRRVARALVVTSRLRGYLLRQGHRAGGALTDLARGTHDLLSLGRDLLQAFSESGELRDSASAELGPLRRTARAVAEGLRLRLEGMMRKPSLAACLSDTYITERNERYVLPVRADAPYPVAGIVHDTSQTGATLFVEPAELVDEGNRLKLARAAVAEHEQQILAGFSREIAEQAQPLRDNLACLEKFDLLLAAARLRRQLSGQLPQLGGRGFCLLDARHPLMVAAGSRVVASDLRLEEPRRCLVISGPNAGGKTVALKTIGLHLLMARAGLAPPLQSGSRVGEFRRLFAVVGDEQDIGRGLSTFSAQLERINAIVDAAGEGVLVLIDEIAADTEPGQGAALAEALLRRLIETGARVVVTTHFEQLKQLAYDDERFANASVGFDTEALQPTYQLHPDIPGRSLTFQIAARLGVDGDTLERARQCLQKDERRAERMLESLEQERRALQQTRRQLERQLGQLQAEAEQHRLQADEFARQRRQLLDRGRVQLLEEISSARRQVAALIESLRGGADMKTAVDASRQLKQLQQRLQQAPAEEAPPPAPAGEIKPGDLVRLVKLGGEGTVLGMDERAGMVSVSLGVMRTRVPLEQVERLPPRRRRRPAAGPERGAAEAAGERAGVEPVRSPDNTIDLRGRRADEAVALLDKFLDELFAAGRPAAFVVHGHGTGALRAAVREYLAASPYPRHFRAGLPEEGGDGVTVVVLK
ncbi:MAG: hypothetical protein DRI34_01880 [Deltaproteobacteria bacterium]|nr:MAG: hypothetical protein DRI34_01880 [Deltaproteobacteria bacterium]